MQHKLFVFQGLACGFSVQNAFLCVQFWRRQTSQQILRGDVTIGSFIPLSHLSHEESDCLGIMGYDDCPLAVETKIYMHSLSMRQLQYNSTQDVFNLHHRK